MDNDTQRNNTFIEKLITLSKTPEYLEWEYLDQDDILNDKIHTLLIRSSEVLNDLSFFFRKDNSFVVLLTFCDTAKKLTNMIIIIPDTFRNPKALSGNEYQENITRLVNVVKRNFPDPDDFIDSILDI
jgi:hypothetical protein